jgi:hypothetical protein
MTEINTDKLNEKLLNFAGFEQKPGDGNYWGKKDEDWGIPYNRMPDLVNSLDLQQQSIWPKLRELGYMIRYQYSELRDNDTGIKISDWTYTCWIYDISRRHDRIFRNHEFWSMNKENPALACALAVEQLIETLEKTNKD